MITRQTERSFGLREPRMHVSEIHDYECDCITCDPDSLTLVVMGKLACAAVVVASGIMFAIDPAGAAAALLATIGR